MELLQMSLSASVLILFVILVRYLLGKRFPRTVLCLLWGIAGCRLLIPGKALKAAGDLFRRMSREWRFWPAQAGMEDAVTLGIPSHDGIWNAPIGLSVSAQAAVARNHVLPVLWMAGAVCLALYFISAYRHCVNICRMSLPVAGMEAAWQQVIIAPARPVRVRMSDRISSPLTFGIIRPVILLPGITDLENRENLYYILEHEMTHIRRWDSVRKIFLAAVVTLHWFNPVVWVMYFLANRDIELACDERVLQKAGGEKRAAYARVLVEWAAAVPENNLMASHLMQDFMKERIVNIMNWKKMTITGAMVSVMLLSGAVTVFAMTPSAGQGASDLPAEAVRAETTTTPFSDAVTVSVTTPSAGWDAKTADTGERDFASYVEDPTLGGIFEVYTVEEYEKVLENVKKYADGDDGTGSGCKAMEEALEKLKADQGSGEYVIYKAMFEKTWEEDGYSMASGFNPTIVMAPELEYKNGTEELTAERYQKDIEIVTGVLDEAIGDGQLTPEKKEIILGKMYDNLEKLK